MGFWNSVFGSGDVVEKIERESKNLDKLAKIDPFVPDDEYTKNIHSSVSTIRTYIRENGSAIPLSVYSRTAYLLDLVDRFVAEQVAEKGLSIQQKPQLRLSVDEKVPGLLHGYMELPSNDRVKPEIISELIGALVAIQRSVEELRDLALSGSTHESKRYLNYAKQMNELTSADSQTGDIRELF